MKYSLDDFENGFYIEMLYCKQCHTRSIHQTALIGVYPGMVEEDTITCTCCGAKS